MNETVEYYNENAEEYCRLTIDADMSACRDRFIVMLSNVRESNMHRLRILDAGCGSGRDAKYFEEIGHAVTAIDASEKMCNEAEKLLHHKVLCMNFSEIDYTDEFDGAWACASLLHVSKNDINDVMLRLHRALKTDGILYASFKYGTAQRLMGDRLFNDYDEITVRELLQNNGFAIEDIFVTNDVRPDRASEKWVNALGRKRG